MISLALPPDANVLCLGAHCDDIDIGCGGTLLLMRESITELDVRWVIFASTPERAAEARASAQRFLGQGAQDRVQIQEFRDGFLPHRGAEVKEAFEALKASRRPDVIFTHYGSDAHQDHRLVSQLTWQTFRDSLILEYEVPKWDGDLGQPNVFIPLAERHVEQKTSILLESYPSQVGRHWFDAETMRGLLRLRGMEIQAQERYAEAFYARKLHIAPGFVR